MVTEAIDTELTADSPALARCKRLEVETNRRLLQISDRFEVRMFPTPDGGATATLRLGSVREHTYMEAKVVGEAVVGSLEHGDLNDLVSAVMVMAATARIHGGVPAGGIRLPEYITRQRPDTPWKVESYGDAERVYCGYKCSVFTKYERGVPNGMWGFYAYKSIMDFGRYDEMHVGQYDLYPFASIEEAMQECDKAVLEKGGKV